MSYDADDSRQGVNTPPVDSLPKSTGSSSSPSWLKSNLATIGSAAVIAVYTAGFLRTRAAAAQFDETPTVRRGHAPRALPAGAAATPAPGLSAPAAAPTVGARPQPTPSHDAASAAPAVAPPRPSKVDAPSKLPNSHASSPAIATPSTAAEPVPVDAKPSTAAVKAQMPSPLTTPSASVSPVKPMPVPAAAAPTTSTPAAPPPTAPAVPTQPATPPSTATTASATADSAKEADKWKPPYKNGVFTGYGTSRHGDIEVKVEIQDGWIISATISRCLTEYSCSWIAALPPQVPVRQSPDVDYVTGATQSSNAFYGALVQAISKAK